MSGAETPPTELAGIGTSALFYMRFALKWHDEMRFRTWLIGLRTHAAVGSSLVTYLESEPDRSRRRQPSGAYSAIVLLRAAVLFEWIRPRDVVDCFDPLRDDILVARSYSLNEENESLRRYLGGDTDALSTRRGAPSDGRRAA